ncbi:hypothetical protein [Amycolatopsis sp. RTGN1]|uniref:hypothetical protein n=1 Tax=Amycolatopsis ponsaeliensis TaxID=2992142 RepID=UPI00254BA705|nr:hypothetical protein [Amycolatopsis sp. RTGN1]
MRPRLLLSVTVLLLLGGCGASPPAGEQPAPPGGEGTGTAASGSPSASPSSSPGTGGCGSRSLVATVRQQPAPQCLNVGDVLYVTTETSPQQPWSLPVSSDESVLQCLPRQLSDGATTATCTARQRGNATVTTTTAAFAGDPHGPPQTQWELHVQVG